MQDNSPNQMATWSVHKSQPISQPKGQGFYPLSGFSQEKSDFLTPRWPRADYLTTILNDEWKNTINLGHNMLKCCLFNSVYGRLKAFKVEHAEQHWDFMNVTKRLITLGKY